MDRKQHYETSFDTVQTEAKSTMDQIMAEPVSYEDEEIKEFIKLESKKYQKQDDLNLPESVYLQEGFIGRV